MRTLLSLVVLAACCTGLSAATFTVTTTADGTSPVPAGSLRQALADAAANPGPDNIVFSLPSLPATITTVAFLRTIGTVTITGPGARQLTISAGAASFQGFIVGQFSTNPANSMPSDATFEDLTITGFSAAGAGGAFNLQNTSHSGTLSAITLNRVAVRNCQISGPGGVVSIGTGSFRATDCEFTSCSSTGTGGAINNSGGTLNLTNCTFSGNTTSLSGGAISGSGILDSCTISGNTATQAGGGINASGTLTMINTIVAGNTSTNQTSEDIAGTITSLGYNCVEVTTGATFTPQATDITGQSPMLSPLGNNGGPTDTMELAATSPCIDAGTSNSASLTTDQRGAGFVRTFDDAAVTDADDGTDMGAFERQPIATPSISSGGTLTLFASSGAAVASTEQSFTVSGSNLTQPITITPPEHWEVSFTAGGPYVAFPGFIDTAAPSGGIVATTTVFIRYNPTAAPPHSGFVVLTSGAASQVDIAVSGALPTATPSGVDFDATETSSGPVDTAMWRVTLSAPLTATLVVGFNVGALSSPSASTVPGDDFDLSTPTTGVLINFVGATGNTITIPAGTSSIDIVLTPVDDILAEAQENVFFTIAAGTGYNVGTGNAFADIDDNDLPVTPAVTVAATDSSADEGNAAGDTGEYTISFSQTPNAPTTTINFTMGGTASTVGGTDYNLSTSTTGVAVSYTGPTGTITVPAGTPSVVVVLTAVDDALTEGNETAVFTVGTGTNYTVGAPSGATVNVLDDDLPVVNVAIADGSADEANASTDTGAYTITLNPAPTSDVTLSFTMSGTADGADYTLSASTGLLNFTFPNGTLTVASSTTSVTMTLTAVDDIAAEGATPETAILTVNASASAYVLGANVSGTVNIVDDDVAVVPTVTVSATDNSASEAGAVTDTGTYEVLISPSPNTPLTIAFTMGGTASTGAGTDYTLSATGGSLTYGNPNGTVDIGIGTTSFTITLTATDDSAMEGATPETAVLTLASSGSYTIGTASSATVSILDNDTPPDVSVVATDASAAEATPASDSGVYTITLNPPANAAMTLAFTMSGTASFAAGADYTLSVTGGTLNYTGPNGTIDVALGTSTVTVTLAVADDTSAEGASAETAVLTLNAGTGYNLGTPNNATVNIADNDTLPVNITTTSLPNGKINEPYNQVISATGGAAPYTWSVQPGGSLPPGVTLAASTTNSTTLSGTPTSGGSFSFVAEVTDGNTTDTQAFTLVISANQGSGDGDGGGSCSATRAGAPILLSVIALLCLAAVSRRRRAA